MYGVTIKDKNYKERKIRISFNPLIREFAADQEHNISKFRKAYIKTANEGRTKNNEPELTEDEEDVADIFVRVNSGGQNLANDK